MTFQDFSLDARLLDGIRKAGFEEPTPIQQAALPLALQGRDLVGVAQTGTGKTAVFVLPILQKLMGGPRGVTRALIITPTRELAQQINENIRLLGGSSGLRSLTIYGGIKAVGQIDSLRRGVDILVACPGRLLDLIQQGAVSLSKLEVLVLDEADRMLDMGFLPDVKRILTYVPAQRQTMLFTATFPKEIEQMAYSTLHNPQRIDVGFSKPATTVTHALYPVPMHLKSDLLIELLRQTDTDSVLVFTRTKRRTFALHKRITKAGFRVTSLHGDRSQTQRDAALAGFKEGRYQIMIATDVAARGLDIDSISHVINYDIPDTADAYVHRIGRTGRAERTGDAFTFVTPEDDDMVRRIEKVTAQRIPRLTLPDFDYEAQPQPRSAEGGTTHFSPRQPLRRGQQSGQTESENRRSTPRHHMRVGIGLEQSAADAQPRAAKPSYSGRPAASKTARSGGSRSGGSNRTGSDSSRPPRREGGVREQHGSRPASADRRSADRRNSSRRGGSES